MNLDTHILADLRRTYLAAVREMALFQDGSREYKRGESLAASTSYTVFSLFGSTAADELRKEGVTEWDRIRVLA